MLLRFQGGQTWLTKQDVAARYVEKHRYNADHWSEISKRRWIKGLTLNLIAYLHTSLNWPSTKLLRSGGCMLLV